MSKTTEMIVGSRKQEHSHRETFMHGQDVEIVNKYKYIGIFIDDKLNWEDNTETILGKAQ